MPTSRSNSELDDLRTFQQRVKQGDKEVYETRILSAKKYAAIEEAVRRQSKTNELRYEQEIQQREYDKWLAIQRQKNKHILDQLQREGKSEAEITAEKQRLEGELQAESKKHQRELNVIKKKLSEEEEKDARRVANIASRAADAQYEKLTIYQRQKVKQELLDQTRTQLEELKSKKLTNAEELKMLRSKRRSMKEGSDEAKECEEQITYLVQAQAELKKQISSFEKAEKQAITDKLKIQEDILKAQREYVLNYAKSGGNKGAAQLLANVETAVAEAKSELEKLDMEIAVNQKLGIDTKDLEKDRKKVQESLKQYEQIFGENGEHLYEAAAKDAAQKKHEQDEITLKKVNAVSAQDLAREKKDERAIEKAQNAKNAQAAWLNFLDPSELGDKIGQAVANSVEQVAAQIAESLKKIDENIETFYEYQSVVEARLQGSQNSYKDALNKITKNVGISGLVSQKEVVKKLVDLSDKGVAYNLELRAFLATISDDIAQTFDAFDSNLMRLIRLQQSDTTSARLGMEASLTKLFNQYFADTSYLSDAADSVAQAIIEANSQLTRDMSIEFEYMVQKWLGSLYSLGMDSNTITTIAQGLNYLGTGNVEALNGNESLQSLFAMSASRAGISYADILTGGLDADTTNALLKSMVEYLKSIANNTDNNQVTKSAYSNVFGFNISDLTAISSLSDQDIKNIYQRSLNYEGAMSELNYQTGQISSRIHLSQKMQTVIDNALMSASTEIADDAITYGTWMVLNIIEDLTGGIAIPGVSVMGNMVDLHTTVTGLAKTGIAGMSLMSSLLGSLVNGSMLGTMDVNKWGYEPFNSRGDAAKGISKGTASGFSESSSFNMVGSASAKDLKTTSLDDATAEAEEDAQITNKNVEENADIYKKIYEAVADEDTTVLEELMTLQTIVRKQHDMLEDTIGTTNHLLRESRIFRTQMSGMENLMELLGPSRIFYSSIVSMFPGDITDVPMSSNYSSSSSASSNSSNSNSSNIITNFFGAVENAASAFTSFWSSNNDNSSSSDGGSSNARLDNNYSTSTAQQISTLTAQNNVSMIQAGASSSSQLITNEGLKVSVNQMSPEVSAYISELISSVVSSSMETNTTETASTSNEEVLAQTLATLLQNNTLNVNVTNDNFDTALQKSAFTT